MGVIILKVILFKTCILVLTSAMLSTSKSSTHIRYTKMTNTDYSDKVITRIRSAASAGVKVKVIAIDSEVTYFRVSSVVNPKAYRSCTTFTNDEVARINAVLDAIKAAI